MHRASSAARAMRWTFLIVAVILAPAHASEDVDPRSSLVADLSDGADRWLSGLVEEIEAGIGPGSRLHITGPDMSHGCTANFVWTDQDANLYLGTAGHCVLPSGTVGTHGPLADFDPSEIHVRVLASTCAVGSLCEPQAGGWADLGPIAFARQRDTQGCSCVGNDFALIQIPAELHEQVRPGLPVFGEPVAEVAPATGDTVGVYGHADGFGEAIATRARVGVGLGDLAGGFGGGFSAALPINFGDSGSALVTLERTDDGTVVRALGLLIAGAAGLAIGVTVERAKALATMAGLTVWTLPGGHPASQPPPRGVPRTESVPYSHGAHVVNACASSPADAFCFDLDSTEVMASTMFDDMVSERVAALVTFYDRTSAELTSTAICGGAELLVPSGSVRMIVWTTPTSPEAACPEPAATGTLTVVFT